VATKITAPDWDQKSAASIYVNPSQPSIAVVIFYGNDQLIFSSLHKCGKYLHFACDNIAERAPIKRKPSIRTQATSIVTKVLKDWAPGHLLIGTGDHDNPKFISKLNLPKVWEKIPMLSNSDLSTRVKRFELTAIQVARYQS